MFLLEQLELSVWNYKYLPLEMFNYSCTNYNYYYFSVVIIILVIIVVDVVMDGMLLFDVCVVQGLNAYFW